VTPVLQNNGAATNVLTGKPVVLNLTDPDSMTVDPTGNLVFVSQADNELIFVHNPGTAQQSAGVLPLTSPTGAAASVDDTLFVPSSGGKVLLTDSGTNGIYELTVPASASGIVVSADTTDGLVGQLVKHRSADSHCDRTVSAERPDFAVGCFGRPASRSLLYGADRDNARDGNRVCATPTDRLKEAITSGVNQASEKGPAG
jgi:hypothetical protein